MSIPKKTILVLVINFIFILVGLVTLSTFYFLEQGKKLDQQRVTHTAQLIVKDLKSRMNHIDILTQDWSAWDDIYHFAQNKNSEFVKNTLDPISLYNLNAHFIAIFTPDLKLRQSLYRTPSDKYAYPIAPKVLIKKLQSSKFFFQHNNVNAVNSGFLTEGKRLLYIASSPIVSSLYKGPVKGFLVIGRYILPKDLQEISQKMEAQIQLLPPNRKINTTRHQKLVLKNQPYYIDSSNPEKYHIYTTITDLSGESSHVIRISPSKTIYREETRLVTQFILFVCICIAIHSTIILIFISKYLLKPLKYLNKQVQKISRTGKTSTPVQKISTDEFGDLSDQINFMLEQISTTREQLINRIHNEMEQVKTEAHKAGQVKSDFLAVMTHELKTPLHHILGMAELISKKYFGELTEKQEEGINLISRSGKQLLVLITDILSLSQIGENHSPLDLKQIDIIRLIRDSIKVIESRAKKKNIHMTCEFPSQTPIHLEIDAMKIHQVLLNLMINAIKFTPESGHIDIKVKVTPLKTDSQHNDSKVDQLFEFSITDTGIGITEEHKNRIFETSYQVDGSSRRRFEGTGLGLALTRRFIDMHSGTIWVESKGEGKGSTFRFTLPIPKTPQTSE